jgi:hypothetical protein
MVEKCKIGHFVELFNAKMQKNAKNGLTKQSHAYKMTPKEEQEYGKENQ